MNDMDHRVIGGRQAESWGIDTALQQVITHHRNAPDLSKLIAFGEMAANCLFPYPALDTQHPFPKFFTRIDKAVKKSTKRGAAAGEQAIRRDLRGPR